MWISRGSFKLCNTGTRTHTMLSCLISLPRSLSWPVQWRFMEAETRKHVERITWSWTHWKMLQDALPSLGLSTILTGAPSCAAARMRSEASLLSHTADLWFVTRWKSKVKMRHLQGHPSSPPLNLTVILQHPSFWHDRNHILACEQQTWSHGCWFVDL